MASKYDLLQLIGDKTCTVASKVTQLVAAEPACTTAQTWTMGFLVVTSVIVILAALLLHERRKRFRETFFR